MKGSIFLSLILLIAISIFPSAMSLRHIKPHSHTVKANEVVGQNMKRRGAETLQIAGSRLPDCSHACGSCSPCRLVLVSFVCSSLEEAETCPIAYKCMCRNKSYPVP